MRLSTAPVNEPFSWPNRMLSTRFSGMAPQLTVMKGRALRSLSPWMARAISSLPTPLSPSMSTGMLEAAARCPSEMTRCMAWPRMMRSPKVSVPSAFFLMRAISPCSASILSALLIDTSRRSGEVGLTTKSAAPARMAVMAASIEPCAVCMMIGGVPGFGRSAPQDLHAVHAGHDVVEQDQGDGAAIGALEDLQGLLAALGGPGLEAETLDRFFEDATLGWIVVDDQDELGHVAGTTQLNWLLTPPRDRPKIEQSATHDLRGSSEECRIWVNASFRFGLR